MQTQLPGPPPANDNRGPAAVAVFWTLTSIAAVIVAARFYARWLIKSIRADDWMMLFSLVLLFITSALITHVSNLGGFRHLMYVPLENGSTVARSMLLAQVFNITAFGTSKFAVGYQLLRVMELTSRYRKAFVWVVMIVTLVYNIIEAVLTMFQCTPAKRAWDPFTPGSCWNNHTKLANIYVGGVYNIVSDVILALLPIPTIWHLQMSVQSRIRLCIVLSLGLLAAISGSVKLSYAHVIADQDLTYGMYDLEVWSGAELFVIIVCASVPPLHVFWKRAKAMTYGSNNSNKQSSKALDHSLQKVQPHPSPSNGREEDEIRLWGRSNGRPDHHDGWTKIEAATQISVSSTNTGAEHRQNV